MREMRGLGPTAIILLGSVGLLLAATPLLPNKLSAPSDGASAVRAQQEPTAPAASGTIKVFVSVRDKEGRAVHDLSPQDMQILEKGQPQKIEALVPATLALGLLIDSSASRRKLFPAVEREPARLLLASVLHGKSEASVVAFSFEPKLLAGPTGDLSRLNAAIELATTNFSGWTAFYAALEFSANALRADESVARVLIVVSDCKDNLSYGDREKVIETLRRTNTRVYVVVIQAEAEVTDRVPIRHRRFAAEMAKATGGLALLATKPDQVRAGFHAITEDLCGLYLVEFRPTNPAHDGRFRKTEIKTARKGLRVTGPEGYYAPVQ